MGEQLERFVLVEGVLALECARAIVPRIARWIPRTATPSEPAPETAQAGRRPSIIRVRTANRPALASPALPRRPRTLSLGGCDAWLKGDSLTLSDAGQEGDAQGAMRNGSSWLRGFAKLGAGVAKIHVEDEPRALEGALTITAALLLGRKGNALAHCGAVVSPEGCGWLVVGDAHSGKSTLTAGAIVAGWRYLADDQCVLSAEGTTDILAGGWPREFHLDEGWTTGAPSGVRRTIIPDRDIAEGRWQRSVRVGGTLLPSIAPDQPTRIAPASSSTVLTALIRQSPWLAADAVVAREIMAIFERVSKLPSHTLRMGLDSYADRSILARLLGELPTRERVLAPA